MKKLIRPLLYTLASFLLVMIVLFSVYAQRDIPVEKLKLKLEAAKRAGYDKAITFEFSHFMSPQSAYIQAHHLYNRYLEYRQTQV